MENIDYIKSQEWQNLALDEKNYARGLWGEFALNRALNTGLGAVRFGDHAEGHSVFLFDRIHIPAYDGGTTEIDSLLISQKGVFCFEVKSWGGEAVFGERNSDEWFTAKSNGRSPGLKSHRMKNPFGQNDYHARHLKKLLPQPVVEQALYGIVLLIDASPFGISPGRWAGAEIDGLFTDTDAIVKSINAAPYIMSGKRVYEISQALSKFLYGHEFRSLGSGIALPNF